MNIGAIAKRTGLPAKTIRYYESIGLIPPALRSEGNYRTYSEQDLQTLKFVQRARGLGFSVKDVSRLLTLWQDRRRASAEVRRMAQDHVGEIDRKIEELKGMRRTLTHLIERCHGDSRPDCPILDDLAGPERRAH
jgi:MerR family transcriptional regulator, copper efflux regulator